MENKKGFQNLQGYYGKKNMIKICKQLIKVGSIMLLGYLVFWIWLIVGGLIGFIGASFLAILILIVGVWLIVKKMMEK